MPESCYSFGDTGGLEYRGRAGHGDDLPRARQDRVLEQIQLPVGVAERADVHDDLGAQVIAGLAAHAFGRPEVGLGLRDRRVDGFVPQQVAVASNAAPSIDKTVVRIRSDQKLPERVVYDTSLPTIVPPTSKVQVAAAPQPPVTRDVTAQARVRDTFAQFIPVNVKKPDPQVQRIYLGYTKAR